MPRNPNKKRCARPGCRAYAVHGEAFCRAHREGAWAKTDAPVASPLGIYAAGLTADERRLLEEVVGGLDATDLEPEIWLLRIVSRRLFAALGREDADEESIRKMATVLYQGISRLAQLLRTRRAVSGEAVDGLAGALAQALTEMETLNGRGAADEHP